MGGTEKERNLSGRHSAAPRVNAVLSTPECRELDSGLQGLPSPVPSLWPILLVCLQGMSLSHRAKWFRCSEGKQELGGDGNVKVSTDGLGQVSSNGSHLLNLLPPSTVGSNKTPCSGLGEKGTETGKLKPPMGRGKRTT